ILVIPDFSFETACPGTPVVFTDLSEIMPFATLSGWQWDFGDPASGAANTSTDQHPSHIYQTSGTYTVGLTVTEASGCQVSAVKNVIVPDVPVISFAPPAISCQQTALPFNASISADVISLQWDFGDPGSGAANTATDAATFHQYDIPGIYTVSLTATNVFGCTATYTDDVVVTANTLNGSITYQPPSPLCEGDNTILTAPAGGSAYQWSTGEQTAQITVAATGVYKVTMTGTNGCTYSPPPAPVDVFEQPNGIIMAVEYNEFGQPVAFFENSYSTCEGEDVHLIVQGSLNYSYQWSGGNGSGTGISFTLDRDNLLTPGDHHFTVTVTDNTTGCTGVEGPFTVTVHPKPEVEIASVPSGFLCENDPATLSVVNPGTGLAYIWNTGETGTSIEVVAGGVYFAQATNQFGCKSRSNEITLHNAPDIDIIPAGCYTRCNPDTLCLPDMSSVASFQWFLDGVPLPAPNGTQPEPVFDQSGGYHVILTDVYGCKSISDVLTLDLIPGFGDITGNVWFDVNHNGVIDGPDTLVSGIPIILNDGTGYADTVLSDLTGYIFSGVPANGYSVVLDTTGLPAGWSAYYTSTNVQLTGCDVEEHFDWLLTLCLPQTLSETHYACPGDGITYDGTFIPAGTTDTFAYTSADGCDSILIIAVEAFEVSAQQVELGACEGTTVSYEGTVLSVGDQQDFVFTDINGCDSVVQVSVVGWPVYAQPLELYACDGAPVFYNGQTFYAGDQQDFLFTSVNGCDSLIQLSVVGADPDSTAIDLEVCEGETIGYNGQQLAAGDSVVFSFTNQYGCDSVVMVSVAQYLPVSFDLSGEEVCWNATDGQIEVQNVSGGLPPWLVSLNGTDYQPALTFDNLASGSYTVYLLDANDCLYTQLVELPEIGPIEVQPTDTTMQCGDVLQLAPVVVSPLPVTWQWDDDGSTQPVLSVTAPGVYGFTASNDCESVSAAVTVRLEATATDRLIYMPNSFSPNGDAVNDCYHGFLAPDTAPDYFVLKIFDRWGDLVFETNDPDACWDGTFRGRQMQPAVFAYFMEMRMLNCDGNPVGVFKEGDIHLIR
ncbi:MAG TPA: PKD domain-containing protein, partial [Bacteroidetes bacterium]|nr:PKD domain-containing protein [Bacteroidota bacterium]